MSNLSQLVQEVKDFLKQKNEAKLTMQTAEGIDVTFEVFDESEIGVGVKASPDGEFTLSNGYKVKIVDGEVTEVEVEIEIPEIPGEEGKKNEGEGETQEPSEPVEPSELEQTKKALEEANALIEQLKSQLAESTSQLEEKSKEIESIESDLQEIKNFYTSVQNGAQERQEISTTNEPATGFKFKIK